jgi:hypothetical protein
MDQKLSLTEISAEIRNKLQTVKTALEFLMAGKDVSNVYIQRALKDLERVEELIL